jgi:two-component system, chemotaxis family, chemotaxis protein CheY
MSATAFENLCGLVVEDNMHMRALIRSLVISLGIRNVLDASNGQDAIALVREHNIDIIITDLSMQPMDGIELTHSIRLLSDCPNPYVPIIMVTGHSERHRVEAARDAGITEFLAKPITAQNLYLRITEVVERPRPFVRCDGFFGPDRRRRVDKNFKGPWRRKADTGMQVEIK